MLPPSDQWSKSLPRCERRNEADSYCDPALVTRRSSDMSNQTQSNELPRRTKRTAPAPPPPTINHSLGQTMPPSTVNISNGQVISNPQSNSDQPVAMTNALTLNGAPSHSPSSSLSSGFDETSVSPGNTLRSVINTSARHNGASTEMSPENCLRSITCMSATLNGRSLEGTDNAVITSSRIKRKAPSPPGTFVILCSGNGKLLVKLTILCYDHLTIHLY